MPAFSRLSVLLFLSGAPGGLLGLLGGQPGVAQPAPVRRSLTVTLTNPEKPVLLEATLVQGSIHVRGYNGRTVLVSAVAGSGKPSPASGRSRPALGSGPPVTVSQQNNHLVVNAGAYQPPLDLLIQVPARCSLKLQTVQNGSIAVEDVQGSLEIASLDGNVTLARVGGAAVVNTLSGRLTASFTRVGAGTPMAFSSLSGPVQLTLPAATKARLKLKSDYGQLRSDFALTPAKRPALPPSPAGAADLPPPATWTYGVLNGGGPDITLQTMSGNIVVRRGK